MMTRTTIETPEGAFSACFSDKGLAALSFPNGRTERDDDANVPAEWKRQTADALNTILLGEQPKQMPPLDFSRGTEFQRRVWKALLMIGAGRTRGYSEIARAIGAPGAARAVGGACGANPIPVLVPCHRVLAANQRLGGFSAGLKWKRLLLEREGVKLAS
jgi:O-6-methylguanine DNA methyltransferase